MRVPNFTPPNQIDHPGLPDEAYNAMQVLSDQVGKLTLALQKNISPEDNENSEVRKLDFENGKKYSVSLQEIKGRPSEVRVLSHTLFDSVNLSWEVTDEASINVSLSWSTSTASRTTATLLIRGGSDGN